MVWASGKHGEHLARVQHVWCGEPLFDESVDEARRLLPVTHMGAIGERSPSAYVGVDGTCSWRLSYGRAAHWIKLVQAIV